MRSSTGASSPSPSPRSSAPAAALGSLVFLALATGCVSSGTHRRALDQRDSEITRLEREVEARDRSVRALTQERNGLLEDLDALRAEREDLEVERASLEATITERDRRLGEMRGTYDALVTDLETELASGQIRIEQMREGIRLNLAQEILFPSGSAELSEGGRRVIETVASRVKDGSKRVEVRGHTDDVGIQGALALRYPTNWELAGARAAGVVRVLQAAGVDPRLLAATSSGEFHPEVSNETAEGRARNRRIEIWLRPMGRAGTVAEGDEPLGETGAPSGETSEGVEAPGEAPEPEEAEAGTEAAPPE